VAVEPPAVTIWTVVSESGTGAVVVEPPGVRRWETVGDEARLTVLYPPLTVTAVTVLGGALTDGELTKAVLETGTV
jgi:hypothetical protein